MIQGISDGVQWQQGVADEYVNPMQEPFIVTGKTSGSVIFKDTRIRVFPPKYNNTEYGVEGIYYRVVLLKIL